MKRCNWLVTCYNNVKYKNGKPSPLQATTVFIIQDRTEREAEKEAMADANVRNADDWTLTESKLNVDKSSSV